MKTSHKWGFIVNPVAGNGFARQYADKVRTKIDEYHIPADMVFTERRGHATELAAHLAEQGATHIVAVGGDGTINETARGIMHRPDITLGLVSAGSGNDFAPVIGFSEHFTDADWHILFQQHTILMDVGKCNENYFLNGMGLGFDAQVASENFSETGEMKAHTGAMYFWHIVKNLLFYKEKEFRSEFNGEARQAITFMKTISIGRRFAGGYFLTPHAIANDGLLDVCLVEPVNLVQRFKLFTKVPTGGHLGHRKVNYFRTDRLLIEFDHEVPHHLDGELFFAARFDVSVLPNQLRILYNPEGNHFFSLD